MRGEVEDEGEDHCEGEGEGEDKGEGEDDREGNGNGQEFGPGSGKGEGLVWIRDVPARVGDLLGVPDMWQQPGELVFEAAEAVRQWALEPSTAR